MSQHVRPFFSNGRLEFLLSVGRPGSLVRKLLYSRFTQNLIDAGIVAATFVLAYLVRFDGAVTPAQREQMLLVLPAVVLLYLGVNHLCRVYRMVWHYVGLRDSLCLARSAGMAALIAFSFNLGYSAFFDLSRVPLGVMFVHPILLFAGWVGVRLVRKAAYQQGYFVYEGAAHAATQGSRKRERRRILLVGAGAPGLSLVQELGRGKEFKVVGFLDDRARLQGAVIEGYPVLGRIDDLERVVREHRVEEVSLCLPDEPHAVVRRIAAQCSKLKVRTTTLPAISEILLGKVLVNQLRPVEMEDLLGRNSVTYPKDDHELIESYRGRRILVTGAGGSIGSELVRQLRDFEPAELILLDKDENSLFEIGMEIREDFSRIHEVVADVRDGARLQSIFERYLPEVVFHAAAYKHVPLMERHPDQAILNNVIGTRNVMEASVSWEAHRFVLVSTDKAVNPTNFMGASKRVAEMLVQQRATRGCKTRLCCVRFGNVLGSRGSVVPIFQRQIREGKCVTVTHPEVRRYFMTIPEAVQLVIQAGSLGNRGEIFLLDMGDPVRIVELARNLIRLSGLEPDRDVRIRFTGLRPGEKLYEELLVDGEDGVRNTRYSKIFMARPIEEKWFFLSKAVNELERKARAQNVEGLQQILQSLDIGYRAASPPRPQPLANPSPATQQVV